MTDDAEPSTARLSPCERPSETRRPRTSPAPRAATLKSTLLSDDVDRRDSALATSSCNASNEPPSPTSLRKTPSLPAIVIQDERLPGSQGSALRRLCEAEHEHEHESSDVILDTFIPTGRFDDLTSDAHISFSPRGSMLLGGKKANRASKHISLKPADTATPGASQAAKESLQIATQQDLPTASNTQPTLRPPSHLSARGRATSQRVLSTDEMTLSRRVRAMYMHGDESAANWDVPEREACSVRSSCKETPADCSSLTIDGRYEDSSSFVSSMQESVISKEPNEAAGGLEDWTDLEGGEVDRYGFIIPKAVKPAEGAAGEETELAEEPYLQRVSTSLQVMSETPRRRKLRRNTSRGRSRSASQHGSEKAKRAKSIFSNHTSQSRKTQRSVRHAANVLPYNKTRRLREEAGDMLKLPPGLAEEAERQEGGRAAQACKSKEIARDSKWRSMAKVVARGADKGGMLFEFDTKDPKLVARTWKGIPDRWRATAWYSFLAASAKADADSPSEEELMASFYELQAENSVEDMQIDVDVPRTISRHVMFRRRYRGGHVPDPLAQKGEAGEGG